MQELMIRSIGEWIDITGDCIYSGKPCGVYGDGKNFALKRGGKMYFFVHDLTISGNENVTVEFGGAGVKTFRGVNEKIKSVHWVDNGKQLDFMQDGSEVKINCTGYPYGTNLVVRIAEAEIE
jgi:alpha-L-fucosidase